MPAQVVDPNTNPDTMVSHWECENVSLPATIHINDCRLLTPAVQNVSAIDVPHKGWRPRQRTTDRSRKLYLPTVVLRPCPVFIMPPLGRWHSFRTPILGMPQGKRKTSKYCQHKKFTSASTSTCSYTPESRSFLRNRNSTLA